MFNHSKCLAVLCNVILISFVGVANAGTNPQMPDPELDLNHQWRSTAQQDAKWQRYFAQSESLAAQDHAALQNELTALQQTKPTSPHKHKQFGFDPKPDMAYLQSKAAAHVAQVILSFQTPSGGWSKRTDMAEQPRQPGQMFGVEKNYIPTFDNGATTTQLRWLAAFYPYAAKDLQPQVQAAIEHGIEFIIQAQYPNGGFAQTYPLRGGYHDAITLNDQVMEELLTLLRDVSADPQFAMLPTALRQQAKQHFALGIQMLLKAQVRLNGKLTIWAAQHHPLTLEPAPARAYELASLVSSESAGITLLLMEIPHPSAEVVSAIEAAVAWFERTQIRDTKMQRDETGIHLIPEPGAKPLWARFYDLERQQPLFVDRDGSIKGSATELSIERQNGYGWYQNNGAAVLKAYSKWRKKHD
jgi:PelA/Pel-15E family pectate lyase